MKGDEAVGFWQGISVRNESSPPIPHSQPLVLLLRILPDGTYTTAQNRAGFSPAFGNWSYAGGSSFKFASFYLVETEVEPGLVKQTLAEGQGEVVMSDDKKLLSGTYSETRTPILDDKLQPSGQIEIEGSFRGTRLSFGASPP